jgi:hypothetical protein
MEPICLQGRRLTGDDLAMVGALIAQHPHWNRTALSRHLCELWNWRNGAGRLKDMAARTLLLKLHARGWVQLPPPQNRTTRPCAQVPGALEQPLPSLLPATIAGSLQMLQPVSLELAHSPGMRQQTRELLAQYNYRGFNGAVGENVQYLAKDVRRRELAVMVFGAAAWKVAVRDQFIGWSAQQRVGRLGLLANQQRFLILPWVRVPHLASHLLALALRRLSRDWQSRYGHPIWLVETFVQTDRFVGTAYQAAAWCCLGQTTGRTRQDRKHTLQTPPKTVWVRPLHPRFREALCALRTCWIIY